MRAAAPPHGVWRTRPTRFVRSWHVRPSLTSRTAEEDRPLRLSRPERRKDGPFCWLPHAALLRRRRRQYALRALSAALPSSLTVWQSRATSTYANPSASSTSDTWSNPCTPHASPPVFFSPRARFRGPSATAFLESLTPSSLRTLAPYSSTLSVFLNDRGGIIDDTIITKHAEDSYYVVTNAGRRDRDLAWFKSQIEQWNASPYAQQHGAVAHGILDGWGLVALQGKLPPPCGRHPHS